MTKKTYLSPLCKLAHLSFDDTREMGYAIRLNKSEVVILNMVVLMKNDVRVWPPEI